MIYRKWKFEDNFEISQIEKESFKEPWTFEMISNTFLNDNFIGFVAQDGENVVGYIAVLCCLDEAEINLVAVKENMRKRGIASFLLNLVQEELSKKGVKKIFLEVRKSNLGAQKLYAKSGFEIISIRPLYYSGKEDAYIMSKSL